MSSTSASAACARSSARTRRSRRFAMRVIGLLRRNWPEAAWGTFAIANFVAMSLWPGWETIPFHFVWISLTLLYGFRVWPVATMYLALSAVVTVTGALILNDAFSGD